MPTLSIERRELPPQPVLIIRRRISRAELQATMAECFGEVFGHCQKVGLPLDGRPFTRYLSTGPGLWTIECGKPLATPAPGEGEIEAVTLPAGPRGDGRSRRPLRSAHRHVRRNRALDGGERRSRRAARHGSPTSPSPADHPDPADWRTEVYWPLAQ